MKEEILEKYEVSEKSLSEIVLSLARKFSDIYYLNSEGKILGAIRLLYERGLIPDDTANPYYNCMRELSCLFDAEVEMDHGLYDAIVVKCPVCKAKSYFSEIDFENEGDKPFIQCYQNGCQVVLRAWTPDGSIIELIPKGTHTCQEVFNYPKK